MFLNLGDIRADRDRFKREESRATALLWHQHPKSGLSKMTIKTQDSVHTVMLHHDKT